jgi:hypothetical protein
MSPSTSLRLVPLPMRLAHREDESPNLSGQS